MKTRLGNLSWPLTSEQENEQHDLQDKKTLPLVGEKSPFQGPACSPATAFTH